MRQKLLSKYNIFFLFLIICGLTIRFFLIPHPGFEADIAYWKGWGLAVADRGIVWLVLNTNYNYPPGFAYILYTIHKIYSLFANPHTIAEFWVNTNLLYLVLIKSISIIADLGIVVLLVFISQALDISSDTKFKAKLGMILALVYFFHPAVIFDGVIWGQVDQLGLFLFLLVIYLLLKERYKASTIIYTLSFLIKFQNIIFIPLFFLYIYKKTKSRGVIQNIMYSAATFLIFILPFLLTHEFKSIYRLMTVNSDWFPYYSLNAFNIWWLVSGKNGMQAIDKQLILGLTSAKQLGLLFFSFSYFIAMVSLFFSKHEVMLRQFVVACSFVVLAFFHLLTQSHDRYLFHLIGLLLVIMLFDGKKHFAQAAIFYLFFSLFFFLNIYIAFYFHYPESVYFPFSKDFAITLSGLVAYAQIFTALVFFWRHLLKDGIRHFIYIGVMAGLVAGVVLIQNLPFLQHQPISLTKITPIERKQDYLLPVVNATVDAQIEPFRGGRLSDNYYFYNRGIGAHANSTIEYQLNRQFSKFSTDYGVDTEAQDPAPVVFSIWGDGKELFRSPPKAKFDNPSTVRLDIDGVTKLVLKIETTGKSIVGAHADWLNPRLMR